MNRLTFDDLAVAAFVYYIVSHSQEGWADGAYRKFYEDCKDEIIKYIEEGSKQSVKEIVKGLTNLLKSWHSLRVKTVDFQYKLENFLSIDDNIIKIKEFYKKELKTSSLRDITEAEKLYQALTEVDGVGPTNSSKILHMLCPKFFVMWDKNIRKEYIGKNYGTGGYDTFLNLMKNMIPKNFDSAQIKNLEEAFGFGVGSKTLAKLLDEYNFVTITKKVDLNKINLIIKNCLNKKLMY